MKKIVFWLVLIVGTIAVIASCSKDEESTTTTTTSCAGGTGLTEVSSCSDTPSGSITGIENTTLTGVIRTLHAYGILGGYEVDNSSDCVGNATLVTALSASSVGAPTGTNSIIFNYAITSSSTFAQRIYFYSDTSCETEIVKLVLGSSDFTVGADVTGLSTSISGKSGTYPSTASKVTYKQTCVGLKGSNDAGVTWLKTFFGSMGVNPAVGTSYSCQNDGDLESALIHLDNSSSTATTYGTTFVYWDDAATDDWKRGHADAVAMAHVLHYNHYSITDVNNYLHDNMIPVRRYDE